MAEMVFRWECPLRRCFWAFTGPDGESRSAMLLGGTIYAHIHTAHRPEEYVQELIDLRPVPIEVAPIQVGPQIRRRTHAETLNHLADAYVHALDCACGGTRRGPWEHKYGWAQEPDTYLRFPEAPTVEPARKEIDGG